jgi:very-short-patch-repair endonuclease
MLVAAGHSRHTIQAAIGCGKLIRVRRGWVARPGADPLLVAAARAGVVLTCITQARRSGLWVLAEDTTHVAADPSAHVQAVRAHVHWARPPVPRHPDALVDPIENVLSLVAACQPFEAALAVWESALNRGMATAEAMGRLDLGPAARALCRTATPWSDSGLESLIVPRLAWMKVLIVPQAWIAGHRVDFLIGERLVLQIDGGTHVGLQRERDVAHDAQLTLLGYRVIRVGYRQVVENWHGVQDVVMRAVAQGLHRAS